MTDWTLRTMEQEPVVRLYYWRVMQVVHANLEQRPTQHFVGCDAPGLGVARVTQEIVVFDLATNCGITRGGLLYELVDESGESGESAYVWQTWCRVNKVASWSDVTDEMYEAGIPRIWP